MIVKNIIYENHSYPTVRNIINKASQRTYKRRFNFFELLGKGLAKIIRYEDIVFFLYTTFYNGDDILHTFNTINWGKGRWVTTFETLVPRYPSVISYPTSLDNCKKLSKKEIRGLSQLAKENCLALIAISENTKNIQLNFLSDIGYPKTTEISKKIKVLQPPQDLLVKEARVTREGPIKFIFVGRDFFRKGGYDSLVVLNELRSHYDNFELTVVSDLSRAGRIIDDMDVSIQEVLDLLNQDWINYNTSLANNEVLDLIRESDVGLLPTRQDTYGFSVLEMQAASIPVITTDIRALPEINNNSCGWLISVPKNKNGEAFYRNNSEASMLATEIRNGLSKVFTEILEDDGNIILDKGSAAFSRICKEHSVEKFSEKLDEIYNL